MLEKNIEKRIYVSPYARTMRNGDVLIAGNFLGCGKWIKIPSKYYDFLVECVNRNMRIKDILQLCDSGYEYDFYNDLLKKLFEIEVFMFRKQENPTLKSVSIDLTSRCNLRCRHCSTSYGEIPSIDMEFDNLKRIIYWCKKNEIRDVTLTGGEIFLLDDINEKLRWIRANFDGKIGIMTNGTLIRDEQISILKETVDSVDISLDGYDAVSVEKIRGSGVYDKVIRVIRKINEKGMDKVGLSMVLTKENWDHETEFIELCEELGVNPVLRIFSPSGRARKFYSEFKNEVFSVDEKLDGLSFRAGCMAGYTGISFFANGQIQPCSAMDNEKYKMGNLQNVLSGNLLMPNMKEWCIVDQIQGCSECNVRYFCASHCQSVNESVYYDEELRKERCRNRQRKLQEAVWNTRG